MKIFCLTGFLTEETKKKWGRIMRLTLFLMVGFILTVSANSYSQSTRLDIKLTNGTIGDLIAQVEKNSEFVFLYRNDELDLKRQVTIDLENASIQQVLEAGLKNQNIAWEVYDRQIILRKSQSTETRELVQQQQRTITGVVTDQRGQPLPGVTVFVQGTTIGTVTNADGNFSLAISTTAEILQFSFVGMRTQEITIEGRTTFTVVMEEETIGLEEVVTIGYGVQRKTSVTAAVSTIDGEKITNIPATNISNTIGGRLAGVIVKQGRGEPGKDGSDIFIRGISTTGNTAPLIIVDGIPRRFQELDPNSIESITILKDAAAVAPFGVAGANGVILVTTKKGAIGEPALTYNGYVGFQNPTVLPEFTNSYQYATLRNIAAANEGLPAEYSDAELQKFLDGSDPDAYPPHNDIWGDLTNRNAILTNHNITISGGTERIEYFGSLGYQSQDGMWATTNSQRYNVTLNLKAQATNTTSISLGFTGRQQNDLYPSTNTGRLFELIGYLHPLYGPLWFSNGMPGNFVTASMYNSGYQKINTHSIYSQLSIEQDLPFIPGLKAKGTIAYDPTFRMDKLWRLPIHKASLDKTQTPYVIVDGIWGDRKPFLNQNYSNSSQIVYQLGLNYDRIFGKHNLSVLGLFEAKNNEIISLGASRTNFDLFIDEINMGSSNKNHMNTSGSSSLGRQMGMVYRLSYNYLEKYLIEASGRYDGSYYFAPGNRFGFFPAFAIGWRLSEENFLKENYNWLYNLKVRASYGEVGALAGSPFQYLGTYNVHGTNYVFGNNAVTGLTERSEPNPNITWERAKKTNVGVEVNLWGKINFEVDYFYEKRSNMLTNPTVITPLEYGIGLSQVNAAVMDNRGIDFTFNTFHNFSSDLRVTLDATFTYSKNKLIEIFETSSTYDNPNRRLTGRPLGTQFGLISLGYFQEDDFDESGNLLPEIATQPWGKVKPGDIRYEDINGDGRINNDDIVVIGHPVTAPGIIYGFSPTIQYKKFTLNLFFQGTGKINWYYHGSSIMPFWGTMLPYVDNFDHWTPDNPNARHPRITSDPTPNNERRSSHWMADASYLRLKNATFSYTLPFKKNTSIYLSGQNLLTWTDMIYYDPEIGRGDHWILDGSWNYPNQKTYSIGAIINF